jgi:predicted nuclease of predicted toxin-antitoxin system
MKFLVDRCAGRRLAEWLRGQGHDVFEARELPKDPGDASLLAMAADQSRILVTIDTDFGALVYLGRAAHAGIIRLPDLPANDRIALVGQILAHHSEGELAGANRHRQSQPHSFLARTARSVGECARSATNGRVICQFDDCDMLLSE